MGPCSFWLSEPVHRPVIKLWNINTKARVDRDVMRLLSNDIGRPLAVRARHGCDRGKGGIGDLGAALVLGASTASVQIVYRKRLKSGAVTSFTIKALSMRNGISCVTSSRKTGSVSQARASTGRWSVWRRA